MEVPQALRTRLISLAFYFALGLPYAVPSSSPAAPPPTRTEEKKAQPPAPKGMVLIPAGPFLKGSTEEWAEKYLAMCNDSQPPGVTCQPNRFSRETPLREIYLDAFYMDIFETTNAEFEEFLKATGRPAPEQRRESWWGTIPLSEPDHPAIGATWYDAAAYCAWRGKRLPTEAEWEKAARGTDGRQYPWGNQEPNAGRVYRANYAPLEGRKIDGYLFTAKVAAFHNGRSPYGIYNMAGNVWEYTADWFDPDYHAEMPARNPSGPPSSPEGRKVIKGGGWLVPEYFLHPALRNPYLPDLPSSHVGIRCAKDYTPAQGDGRPVSP